MGKRARRWIGISAVVAVVAILGILGVVVDRRVHRSRVERAIADIGELQADIENYYETNHTLPSSFEDVGHGGKLDPWGNPYLKRAAIRYWHPFLYDGTYDKRTGGGNLLTLNRDYDLFSAGPDGKWKPALSAEVSRDDIIRANDGGFIGPATRH